MLAIDKDTTAARSYDLDQIQTDIGDLRRILENGDDIGFQLARVGNPEHDAALDRVETLVRLTSKQARLIDQQVEAGFATLRSDTK